MTSPLLAVSHLDVHFAVPAGTLRAVDDVDLEVQAGETVGLVGESGCGKSTLGKTILRLTTPTRGSILFDGLQIAQLGRRAMRPIRPKIQMVFQDPYASLNPRLPVGALLDETLAVHKRGARAERSDRVIAMLQRVGLRPDAISRYPHEFSGGQRQRIAIARALILDPRLVICDEPVSALDVSVRAQVINLLSDLRRDLGLAYLFISHDLSVVRHIADRVAVMYLGRIVETGASERLWAQPRHPYTQALIAAMPRIDPRLKRSQKTLITGELPSPLRPPSGCAFRTRCPQAAERCAKEKPVLRALGEGRMVACHFP